MQMPRAEPVEFAEYSIAPTTMPTAFTCTHLSRISLIALLGLAGCAVQPTSSGYSFQQDSDALFGKMLRDYSLPEGGTATLRQGQDRRQYSLKLNASLRIVELGKFDLAVPEFDTTLNEANDKKVRMIVLRTRNPGCETHYVLAEIRGTESKVRTIGNCHDALVFSAAEGRELQMRDPLGRVFVLANGRFSGPFVPTTPAAAKASATREQPAPRKAPDETTTKPRKAPKPSTPAPAPAPAELPTFKSVDFDSAESRAPSAGN